MYADVASESAALEVLLSLAGLIIYRMQRERNNAIIESDQLFAGSSGLFNRVAEIHLAFHKFLGGNEGGIWHLLIIF